MALDFMEPSWRIRKVGAPPEIFPRFTAKKTKDLMVRGGDFYAIWDERKGLWSQDLDDVVDLIDTELENYKKSNATLENAKILKMFYTDTGTLDAWHKFVQKQLGENFHPLNETLVFENTPVCRENYASKRLPYSLKEGDHSAWDELMNTLYSPSEKHKIEWTIGAIVNGASKTLQKFLVFYGDSGTGKSTVMNIMQKLFDGYWEPFKSKELGMSTADFALEPFKNNPLVAIEHDGNLSKIEDNTRLNSLVSHESMMINAKYSKMFPMQFHTMLIMGTNSPVKITDSKSGVLRRLIDVVPTGNIIPRKQYNKLMKKIDYELGAIAWHCKEVFEADPEYYDSYRPSQMIGATNDFYNFLDEYYDELKEKDCITLNEAWLKYKQYCDYAKVLYPYSLMKMKEELKAYYNVYKPRTHVGDKYYRNWYSGFKIEKFGESRTKEVETNDDATFDGGNSSDRGLGENRGWLSFSTTESPLDILLRDCPAQYANPDTEKPVSKWSDVETILADLNTSELHYVRVPENHIVIDFDLKNENGEKDFELNLREAEKWPQTYAELSKSGKGIHLHYIYTGDPSKLSAVYDKEIEIKVFSGKSSLRRKLTRCNDLEVTTISSGLPLKEEVKVVSESVINDEKHLRALIGKALRKEIQPGATVTCVQFIQKILNDAYESGMPYDVSDMQAEILAFAGTSSNHAHECIDICMKLPYKSDDPSVHVDAAIEEIVFFDVEVFPNLFIVCVKPEGKDVIAMVNPTSDDIRKLCQYRLVGFNNRRYDNHILYARMMGANEFDLFTISQNIINGGKSNSVRNSYMYREAYNLSYTDVYDFCATKQSLKKWEIQLGIHHQELGLAWDEPVPEEMWPTVADYCKNDVIATEAVFYANAADFKARQILVDMANSIVGPGSCENDTTNMLTTRLIVRNEKNPQALFVYPNLAEEFPGYEYDPKGIDPSRYISKDVIVTGKSIYRGYDPGEGGFVYARHGAYGRADCYDSASHHPSSLIAENGFGPFTENFKMLLDLRLHIKHKEYDIAGEMFGGILKKYLTSPEDAEALSYALKIAINSVYGLTAAHFDNKLHDPRNIDNWVAKRGALFMIDLLIEVEKLGYRVIHIKTDSIKIENPDDFIFQFVYDYGKKFGYTFEIEHKFEKICLVNDAVYVCKYTNDKQKHAGMWDATGDQFKQKFTFKTLFSHEPIEFKDLCKTYTVAVGRGLYLDMNEGLPDSTAMEKERDKLIKKWKKRGYELSERYDKLLVNGDEALTHEFNVEEYHNDWLKVVGLNIDISKCHDYHFVGKAGQFCPIKPGYGGGLLYRENNGKMSYTAGATGYRWLESEYVQKMGLEDAVDLDYFRKLVDEAKDDISSFLEGSEFESFEDFAV